jgi:nitroreductase
LLFVIIQACRTGGGGMELSDVMRSQHACRYYQPDPVPLDLLYQAVELARFGPQGGNRQPVRFVIVRDVLRRARLGEWYTAAWTAYRSANRSGAAPLASADGTVAKATWVGMSRPAKALADADQFAAHFAEHPTVIVVCVNIAATHPTDTDLGRLSVVGGASVYPIAQNLCLALRSFGVATTFTTLLCAREPQVKELLGIPAEWATACHIVAGYPAAPFPTKLHRAPVEQLAFLDSWDRPLAAPADGPPEPTPEPRPPRRQP